MKNSLFSLPILLFVMQYSIAQTGNVGIGTSTPKARLHVADSSVLFTGPATLPLDPTAPPIEGAGTRLMWYPQKAAFRAGQVDNDAWNSSLVGTFSFAAGTNTKASGTASTSLGSNTTASGSASLSAGDLTRANGFASFATGDQAQALGYASSSLGYYSRAIGNFSTCIGNQTVANAYNSLSIGRFNEAGTTSPDTWVETEPLFLIGNGSSESSRSNALTILKNGNMGIGTSNPALGSGGAGLHVKNNTFTQLRLESSVNNASIELKPNGGSLMEFGSDINNQLFVFNRTRSLYPMVLNAEGFLGVGVATPSAKLTVEGNDATPNGVDAAIKLQNRSSTNAWYLRAGGGSGTITPSNGFSIADNNAYHFNISSDGNVGIGIPPSSAKLHVNGNMRVEGAGIVELGAGIPGKEVNAGKIGYNAFGQSALTLVGAGTNALNRSVYVYAEGGTTLNGPLGFNGALRVNGNTGTTGQVLTSNGTEPPTWQTPSSAYQNNIRFAFLCSDPTNTSGNLLFTNRYNTNTSAVTASGSTMTFNVTGIYRFDIAITGLVVYGSSLGYEPTLNLNFITSGGTGSGNNPVASARLFKSGTSNRYTATAYTSTDMYLTAGQSIQMAFGYANAPSGFTEIDSFGYLRGYLISP